MTASPAALVIGVGVRIGAPAAELRGLLDRTLHECGLAADEVSLVVTAEGKDDAQATVDLASGLGVPIRTFTTAVLAARDVPSPSSLVERHVGSASVAEAAVLAAGAKLLVGKRSSPHCTLAVGRARVPV